MPAGETVTTRFTAPAHDPPTVNVLAAPSLPCELFALKRTPVEDCVSEPLTSPLPWNVLFAVWKLCASALTLEEPTPASPAFNADSTGMRLPDDSAVFYKTMPPRVVSQPEMTPTETPVLPADAALDGFDGNARVLAAVLAVALLIALTALIYVFIL